MAGVIKNKISDMLVVSWESLAIAIDNWITGIVENEELKTNRVIRINLREIAERHLPFVDKIDELKMAVSALNMQDEAAKQSFLDGLDEIAQKGIELREGVHDVELLIKNSGLTKEEKEKITKALRTCETTMKDYYCSKIQPYTYKKFMAVIRRAHVEADISIIEQQNGSFVVFYPAQHIDLIDRALEYATISYQSYPSPDAVERAAYMGAADTSQATVLTFDNLSAELAERAVEDAHRYGYVNFAKAEMPGTDPKKYQIMCDGGSTPDEKTRNYREAIEIITKSAIAISGPAYEANNKKMRFMANEFDRMDEGVKSGSGYVFSVRQMKHMYENNTSEIKEDAVIDSRNFVRFTKDEHSGRGQFYTQNKGVITTTVYESETDRYDKLLYHTVNAGLGDKIYISDERMDELKHLASSIANGISSRDSNWIPSIGADFPKSKLMELSIKARGDAINHIKDREAHAADVNAAYNYEAVSNALALSGKMRVEDLTADDILYGVISEEIEQKHTFKMKEQTNGIPLKIAKEAENAINRMVAWNIDSSREETAIDIPENKLRTEHKSLQEDFSIGPAKIVNMINRIDPQAFIDHELTVADADQMDQSGNIIPSDRLTISKVKSDDRFLDQYFKETSNRAKSLLTDIRVHMVEAREPLECHDIDTRYTKLVHMTREDLLNTLAPIENSESDLEHNENTHDVQTKEKDREKIR